MSLKYPSIALVLIYLTACNGNRTQSNTPDNQSIHKPLKQVDLLNHIPFRKAPFADTTNFDNFNNENRLSNTLVSKLHLKSIEPNYEAFYARYRLAVSTNVDAVVVTMSNENELKTYLITFHKVEYEIIDKVIIAYDEIAESMTRTEAKIYSDELVITNYSYWEEEPSIEINRYRIEKSGKLIRK